MSPVAPVATMPTRSRMMARTAGHGRVIFSSNAGLSFDAQGRITSIAGAPLAAYRTGNLPEYFHGPALSANPYLADGAWDENTPTIAGLDGGADPFGLVSGFDIGGLDFVPLDDDPGDVPDAPPPNAVVAIYRFDTAADALAAGYSGPLDADYTGYDLVLFINLSTVTLANPQLGLLSAGDTGSHMTQLQTGSGVASEKRWTRVTIGGLGAGQVWATLVPDLGPGELSGQCLRRFRQRFPHDNRGPHARQGPRRVHRGDQRGSQLGRPAPATRCDRGHPRRAIPLRPERRRRRL